MCIVHIIQEDAFIIITSQKERCALIRACAVIGMNTVCGKCQNLSICRNSTSIQDFFLRVYVYIGFLHFVGYLKLSYGTDINKLFTVLTL